MIALTGSTYAYYTYEVSDNVIGSNVTNDIDINYKQGSFINNSFMPINDNYAYLYANKYDFEIIVDKKYSDYEIGYLLSFININLDSEYYNWLEYIKFELYDVDNQISLFLGNFKNLKDNTLNLNNNMVILNTDYLNENNRCYNKEQCIYNYQLRLWVSDNCIEPNNIETCPNYQEQYNKYKEQHCKKINDNSYDCSSTTEVFVYENKQNELQNKSMSMNIKIDTGLRK